MHLVTVVYAEELNYLCLQARSFARFLAPEPPPRITVVINDPDRDRCREAIHARILPEYGPHARNVAILDGARVAPDAAGLRGYVAQQVLKLRHAAAQPGDCVTLDAKNFLVAALRHDSLFAPGGRPRCRLEVFDAPQAAALDECYAWFDVPPSARPARVPAMMTPFVLNGPLVRAMIGAVEERSGGTLESVFAGLAYPSEYLLYAAFLVHRGIDLGAVFAAGPAVNLTLWGPYRPGAEAMRAAFSQAAAAGQPVFAIHRKRMQRLTPEEGSALHEALVALGLAGADEDRFWERFEPFRAGPA